MNMPEAEFRLEHVNMPARDPETLASWYGKTFDLQAEGRRVTAPGLLLVFVKGEPVQREELHVGFRLPSQALLEQWAHRLGGTITPGPEFNSFRTLDLEGNCVEIYCKAGS
jgi:hypothetical protein